MAKEAPVRGAAADVPSRYWSMPLDEVVQQLHCAPEGLSDQEAAARLLAHGANRLTRDHRTGALHELARQFVQPVVVMLVAATALSALVGEQVDAGIILVIVLLSGLLGFWQEHRASVVVARLLDQVQVQVEVRRGGRVRSVSPDDVVSGDVIVLNAGDIIPCDCRVVTAAALQVDESALTGETYPRHKTPEPVRSDAPVTRRDSALHQGTHVVSGRGEALAVITGQGTQLGQVVRSLEGTAPTSSFEQGCRRLGLLLAQVTVVLTAAILVLNVALDRPPVEALLFSLALAVGVTPQMLPAIVAVSLSTGARRLAHERVVVRRLDAIEDLGSMDVLCTDKTGTLTQGRVTLAAALDTRGRPDDRVAEVAAANAMLQTGYSNPVDEAVLAHGAPKGSWRPLAEVPFDFDRKRLSVLADGPSGPVLLTKGAVAKVLEVCDAVAADSGATVLDEQGRAEVQALLAELSGHGYRVLAVAERRLPDRTSVSVADERGMTLCGLLAFEDPPKEGLADVVDRLRGLGVRLCMLTGDNRLAAAHIAGLIGRPAPVVLTGAEVDALPDQALARTAAEADAFAELTPLHKERLIQALRSRGSVVGYLGDGINDAGPLHLADVGISVDTGVDVAKAAAALVLLDKDLGVLVDGIRTGRETFVNTVKYVRTTVSANFGNTASMAAASAFLPFLPMLPGQVLLLNLLTDIPSLTLAHDRVDAEDVAAAQHWDVHALRNFMVTFGLLSSAFDLATFAVLLQVFHAGEALFHTGWFVGSALTEVCVLLVLRSRRLVFRSRPGTGLVVSSVLVALTVVVLPLVPATRTWLALAPLTVPLVVTLLGIVAAYVVAAEVTTWLFHGARTPQGGAADPQKPGTEQRRRRIARIAAQHGHQGHPAAVLRRRRLRTPPSPHVSQRSHRGTL